VVSEVALLACKVAFWIERRLLRQVSLTVIFKPLETGFRGREACLTGVRPNVLSQGDIDDFLYRVSLALLQEDFSGFVVMLEKLKKGVLAKRDSWLEG